MKNQIENLIEIVPIILILVEFFSNERKLLENMWN